MNRIVKPNLDVCNSSLPVTTGPRRPTAHVRIGIGSLFVVLAAFLGPTVFVIHVTPVGAVSPPNPTSGAQTTMVKNADFSNVGNGQLSPTPTNYDFAAAAGTVGTPPANYNFDSQFMTGWTLTNASWDNPGEVDINTGGSLTSPNFTVTEEAQWIKLDVNFFGIGSATVSISGNGGTSWTDYAISCGSPSCWWQTFQVPAATALGKSNARIRVTAISSPYITVDMVGIPWAPTPGWTPTTFGQASIQAGGPTGNFLQSTTTVRSLGYIPPSGVQNASFDIQIATVGGSVTVNVVWWGTTYAGPTITYAEASAWVNRSVGVGPFVGTAMRLEFVPSGGTTFKVDNAGLFQHVVQGWSAVDTNVLTVGETDGLRFLSNVEGVVPSVDGYSFPSNHKAWFRVCYRPKNGSTTFTVKAHPSVGGETTLLSGSGGAANVWRESYFSLPDSLVYSYLVLRSDQVGSNRPDVSCFERVDGSSNNRVLGNAAAAGVIPPGLSNKPVTSALGIGVEATTGEFRGTLTDLALPGRGVPLSFTRSYGSLSASNAPGLGVLGPKWSHNWQMSLAEVDSGNAAIVHLPGGAYLTFWKNGSTFVQPAGIEAVLVKTGSTWTLTTKGQLVYNFDATGRWTSVADRWGNTTSLAYDGSGRVATVTEQGGRALSFTYDGVSRITAVSDGLGRSVGYAYGANGDLTTVTDVRSNTVAYSYSNHLLTQVTDQLGHYPVRNTYDTRNRPTTQLDALGGTVTIAYATPGTGATRVTNQRSKNTTAFFDTSLRVNYLQDHDTYVVKMVYDSDNNRTSVTNQLDKVWTATYDSAGNVTGGSDPLGIAWSGTFNALNDPTQLVAPSSKVTPTQITTGISVSNLQTTVTNPDSDLSNVYRNSYGDVTSVSDELGHSTSFAYDSYGNRLTVTSALGKTWSYVFDNKGRVSSVTDPLGHASSATYDAANHPLTSTNALSQSTTSSYDAAGRLTSVTDANGKVTSYGYDAKNQVTSVTDAASGTWAFTYDGVGNLLTKTNPRSKATTYTYDNENRLKTETDPLSHVWTYNYDAAGRLTSKVDAKSQTITYSYNARNELTIISYPNSTSVTYSYWDSGALKQMVDATGTTSYSYDNLNRLTSVTFPGTRTVSYAYDDASRRTSMTYPGGVGTVNYTYDNANRLTGLADWNAVSTSYAYDDANRLTAATLPNGVVSSYGYDNADHLTSISHVKSGTTLASVSYTLDSVGNRTQRVDDQGTHSYSYDNLYRLTQVTYPGPSTTSYAYDAFSNRTSMTEPGGTTTYTYNNADQLTSYTAPGVGTVSYTWDNNGNLTNRGSDSFGWDYENRMTSATVAGVTTTFAYRADGLRNSRTVGGNTTTFTWDVAGGLPTVIDDGAQYLYGPSGLLAQKQGSSKYYYLSDGLGSVMKTTDASGAVVNAYTYDVYGKKTSSSGSQTNDFDFAGQQSDASTGLQYLRARYMDTKTGTFMSRDPLASGPGWTASTHGYGGANPVNATDPSGTKVLEDGEGTVATGGNSASGDDLVGGMACGVSWDPTIQMYYDGCSGLVWQNESSGWHVFSPPPVVLAPTERIGPPTSGTGIGPVPSEAKPGFIAGLTGFGGDLATVSDAAMYSEAAITDYATAVGCIGWFVTEGLSCAAGYATGRLMTAPLGYLSLATGVTSTMIECGLGGPSSSCVKSIGGTLLPSVFQIAEPNVGVAFDWGFKKVWGK